MAHEIEPYSFMSSEDYWLPRSEAVVSQQPSLGASFLVARLVSAAKRSGHREWPTGFNDIVEKQGALYVGLKESLVQCPSDYAYYRHEQKCHSTQQIPGANYYNHWLTMSHGPNSEKSYDFEVAVIHAKSLYVRALNWVVKHKKGRVWELPLSSLIVNEEGHVSPANHARTPLAVPVASANLGFAAIEDHSTHSNVSRYKALHRIDVGKGKRQKSHAGMLEVLSRLPRIAPSPS